MRRHHQGRAAALEAIEYGVEEQLSGPAVQLPGRLVGKHETRREQKGANHCHPLRLPAGQLLRQFAGETAKAERLKQPGRHATGLDILAGKNRGQLHILEDRQSGKETGSLENEADMSRPELVERPEARPVDAAMRRPVQAAQQMKQCGLAAAGGAGQGDACPRGDPTVDVAQDDVGAVTSVREFAADAFCHHQHISHCPPFRP